MGQREGALHLLGVLLPVRHGFVCSLFTGVSLHAFFVYSYCGFGKYCGYCGILWCGDIQYLWTQYWSFVRGQVQVFDFDTTFGFLCVPRFQWIPLQFENLGLEMTVQNPPSFPAEKPSENRVLVPTGDELWPGTSSFPPELESFWRETKELKIPKNWRALERGG